MTILFEIKHKLRNGDEIVIVYFNEIMWGYSCNFCGQWCLQEEGTTKIHRHALEHLESIK